MRSNKNKADGSSGTIFRSRRNSGRLAKLKLQARRILEALPHVNHLVQIAVLILGVISYQTTVKPAFDQAKAEQDLRKVKRQLRDIAFQAEALNIKQCIRRYSISISPSDSALDNEVMRCIQASKISTNLMKARVPDVERTAFLEIIERRVRPLVLAVAEAGYRHSLDKSNELLTVTRLEDFRRSLENRQLRPDGALTAEVQLVSQSSEAARKSQQSLGKVLDKLVTVDDPELGIESIIRAAVSQDPDLG